MAKTWKWFAGWLLALGLVVGLAGCGNDVLTDRWLSCTFVGIVNDSAAILAVHKVEEECQEMATGNSCKESRIASALRVVGYRSAVVYDDSSYWVPSPIEFVSQVTDSLVAVTSDGGDLGFWKIGQPMGTLKPLSWSGCNFAGQVSRVRPWRDGQVLLLGKGKTVGADSCHYATLDTLTGKVVGGRFNSDNAWLAACEDVTYQNGRAICLMARTDQDQCGLDLVLDGLNVDSVRYDSCGFLGFDPVAKWLGHYPLLDIFTLDEMSPAIYNRADLLMNVNTSFSEFDTAYAETWVTATGILLADRSELSFKKLLDAVSGVDAK